MTNFNWKQRIELNCGEDAENVKNMMVTLSNRGNPDHGEDPYQPISGADRVVPVESFYEASKICSAYIDQHRLGGGSWAGGEITQEGKVIARVSYNGRVWGDGSVLIS